MNERQKQMRRIRAAIVAIITDELDDEELAALNIVAQNDQSPYGKVFDSEIVEVLFIEHNGTLMHQQTKAALAEVVQSRLFNT